MAWVNIGNLVVVWDDATFFWGSNCQRYNPVIRKPEYFSPKLNQTTCSPEDIDLQITHYL